METASSNPDAAAKDTIFGNVDVDMVFFSPPCQGFSSSSNRNDKERNTAFEDTIFGNVDMVCFSQPCQGFSSLSRRSPENAPSKPKDNDIRLGGVIAALRKAGFISKEATGDENKEVSLASIIAKAYNAGKDVVVVPSSGRNMKGETLGSGHKVRGNSRKTLTVVVDVPGIDTRHASPPREGRYKMEENKMEMSVTKQNAAECGHNEKGGDDGSCNKRDFFTEKKMAADDGNENEGDGFEEMEMSMEKNKMVTDNIDSERGGDTAGIHRSSGLAMNIVLAFLLLTMITAAFVVAWLLFGYYYNNNMLALSSNVANVAIGDNDESDKHRLGNDDGFHAVGKMLRGAVFMALEE